MMSKKKLRKLLDKPNKRRKMKMKLIKESEGK